jgi:hypothetical protein
LAGGSDTDGAFDLVESKMKRGTEPPPHIHDREDELFYILAGEIKVSADGQVDVDRKRTAADWDSFPARVPATLYQQYAKVTRRDTDMRDFSAQSEDELRAAHICGVEEKNRRLQILLSELSQKNHELRLEVAHLHGEE